MIAQTYREVAASGPTGLTAEQTSRLEDLRTRRQQAENAIRSLLALDGQSGPFIQSELGRLNGELNTLNQSITELETTSPTAAHSATNLADVSAALQRLDPIWEVLIPDEQRRVLELLVDQYRCWKGSNRSRISHRRRRADRHRTIAARRTEERQKSKMIQSLDKKYPGRSVRRDGNQIVVTIPVKFYRRNGRQMVKSQASGDGCRETQIGSQHRISDRDRQSIPVAGSTRVRRIRNA